MLIIVLCILFLSLIIHQRFYSIEGKKNKLKSVTKAVSKTATNVASEVKKEVKKDANQIGKGFKALTNAKFIKFVKQLFTKDFLKKV